MPTTELRSEWAAQRIKGLSFFSAAKAAFFGNKDNKIKSLISEFHYPRFGPGQMWETMADEIIAAGGEVRLNTPVTKLEIRDGRDRRDRGGRRVDRAQPRDLLAAAARDRRHGRRRRLRRGPGAPRGACATATSSRSRWSSTARTCSRTTGSTSTIRACASGGSRTSAPGARGWSRTSRRRPSAWSTSASAATTCGRWTTTTLVELAKQELAQLGLVDPAKVEKGYVTRVPLAYPMYDADYAERVDVDPRAG